MKTLTKYNLPSGINTIIWDGTNVAGILVSQGTYSISLTAVDETGNRSLTRYATVVVVTNLFIMFILDFGQNYGSKSYMFQI